MDASMTNGGIQEYYNKTLKLLETPDAKKEIISVTEYCTKIREKWMKSKDDDHSNIIIRILREYCPIVNISPSTGPLFSEYLKMCTKEQFMIIYLQILYTINTLHNALDFSHYSLSPDKVKVEKVSFSIPYLTEKGYEKISPSIVPFISGYDKAHIKIKGDIIAHVSDRCFLYNTHPLKSYLLYDAYHLLCLSLSILQECKNPIFNEVKELLHFFNTKDTPKEILKVQRTHEYFLPPCSLEFNDFCKFVRQRAIINSSLLPSLSDITRDYIRFLNNILIVPLHSYSEEMKKNPKIQSDYQRFITSVQRLWELRKSVHLLNHDNDVKLMWYEEMYRDIIDSVHDLGILRVLQI